MDHPVRTTHARRSRPIIRISSMIALAASWAAPLAHGQERPDRPGPSVPEASSSGAAGEPQVVEYGGAVVPGKRIELDLQGVEAPGARYEWAQVEGPPLRIEDPTGPRASLVVPARTRRLGFILTVSDARGGVKRYRINVPVQADPTPASDAGGAAPGASCRAEAGDDQIGLVGCRLTLDGSGSVPAEGLLYRWIQVAGPAAGEPRQNGPYYSFRPTAPGYHRFALVVAGATISEPDYVTVTVGEMPSPAVQAPPATAPSPASRPEPSDYSLELIAIGAALAPNGAAVAGPLADVFDAAAGALPGYPTYAAVQADIVRRCDAIVPGDPAARAQWSRLVLEPLTQYTVASLAPVGLDPRSPASAQQAMGPAQRQQLADVFRSIARVLRPRAPIAR